jgi:hypothetical protein
VVLEELVVLAVVVLVMQEALLVELGLLVKVIMVALVVLERMQAAVAEQVLLVIVLVDQ